MWYLSTPVVFGLTGFVTSTLSSHHFSINNLFYNANLLNICDRARVKINDLDFLNNVNLLIYDKSIEENCKTIKKLHRKFETWTRKHECIFAWTKYQLIHLLRNFKKFNMSVSINIIDNESFFFSMIIIEAFGYDYTYSVNSIKELYHLFQQKDEVSEKLFRIFL